MIWIRYRPGDLASFASAFGLIVVRCLASFGKAPITWRNALFAGIQAGRPSCLENGSCQAKCTV